MSRDDSGYRTPVYVRDGSPVSVRKRDLAGAKDLCPTTVSHQGEALQFTARRSEADSGLYYEYYEGTWYDYPDFDGMTPDRTGRTDSVSLARIPNRQEDFAVRLTGYLDVLTAGRYDFSVSGDDDGRIVIDGQTVVSAHYDDGWNTGSIELAPGRHPVAFEVYQRAGKSRLQGAWRGPGFGWQELPSGVLSPRRPDERSGQVLDVGVDDVPDVTQGLDYEVYDRTFDKVDRATTPDRTGSVPAMEVSRIGARSDADGVRTVQYCGFVDVVQSGTYDFGTADGTTGKYELLVDGETVDASDGTHERVELDVGLHAFRFRYAWQVDQANEGAPTLTWKRDGESRTRVQSDRYHRVAPEVSLDHGIDYEFFDIAEDPPTPDDWVSKARTVTRKNEPARTGITTELSPAQLDGFRPDTLVRYQAYLYVPAPDEYTFEFDSVDDGAALWIDGEQIAKHWLNQGGDRKGSIELARGFHRFEVYYVNTVRSGDVNLRWKSNSGDGGYEPVGRDLYRNTTGSGFEYYYRALRTEDDDRQVTERGPGPDVSVGAEQVTAEEWGRYRELPIPDAVRPAGGSLVRTTESPPTEPGVRVVSDGDHLYVLRAGDDSIYASKYAMRVTESESGGDSERTEPRTQYELVPARQVRYEHSGSPNVPADDEDGVSSKTPDGRPFRYPVVELPLGGTLDVPLGTQPEFAAELVDAKGDERKRWLLFVADPGSPRLFCYSFPQANDGLFDLRGMVDGDGGYLEPDRVLTLSAGDDGGHYRYGTVTYDRGKRAWSHRSTFLDRIGSIQGTPETTDRANEVVEAASGNEGIVFESVLDAPGRGTYEFEVGADDCCRLLIDGQEVASSLGVGTPDSTGSVHLEAGQHHVALQYANTIEGSDSVHVDWKKPGSETFEGWDVDALSPNVLRPAGPPSTAVYHDRSEATTGDGEALDVKGGSRLKLMVPVAGARQGTVDLDFALGADGVPACLGPPASVRPGSGHDVYEAVRADRIVPPNRCVELTESGTVTIQNRTPRGPATDGEGQGDAAGSTDVNPEGIVYEIEMHVHGTPDEEGYLWGQPAASGTGEEHHGPFIEMDRDGGLTVGFRADGRYSFAVPVVSANRSVWNDLVVGYRIDGDEGRFYVKVNGRETTISSDDATMPATPIPEQIGRGFDGKMRDVVYKTAADENSELKKRAHWPMSGGYTETKVEDTVDGHTGKLVGGRWAPYGGPESGSPPRTYLGDRGLTMRAGLLEPGAGNYGEFGNVAPGSRIDLLDGADATVHAYYRTPDDVFMDAGYDPKIQRDVYEVPWTTESDDQQGSVYLVSNQPMPGRDGGVDVSKGSGDGLLDVTLRNGHGDGHSGITEKWRDVPERLSDLRAVLSGDAISDPTAPELREEDAVFYDYSGRLRVGRVDVGTGDGGLVFGAKAASANADRGHLRPTHVRNRRSDGLGTVTITFERGSSQSARNGKSPRIELELDGVPASPGAVTGSKPSAAARRRAIDAFVETVNGRADQGVYDYAGSGAGSQGASITTGDLYELPAGTNRLPVAVLDEGSVTTKKLAVTGDDLATCTFAVEIEADGGTLSYSGGGHSRRPAQFVRDVEAAIEDESPELLDHLVFGEPTIQDPDEPRPRLENGSLSASTVTAASARTLTDFVECIDQTDTIESEPPASPLVGDFDVSLGPNQGVTVSNADYWLYSRPEASSVDVLRATGSELYTPAFRSGPEGEAEAVVDAAATPEAVVDAAAGRWRPEPTTASLDFRNAAEGLRVPDANTELTAGGDVTVEAWMSPQDISEPQRNSYPLLFANPDEGGLRRNDVEFHVEAIDPIDDSGSTLAVASVNGMTFCLLDPPFRTDAWNHLAAVYDSCYGVSLSGYQIATAGGEDDLTFGDAMTISARTVMKADRLPDGVVASKQLSDDGPGYELRVTTDEDPLELGVTLTLTFELEDQEDESTETVPKEITQKHDLETGWLEPRFGQPMTIIAQVDVDEQSGAVTGGEGKKGTAEVDVSLWTIPGEGHPEEKHEHYSWEGKNAQLLSSDLPLTLGGRRTNPPGMDAGVPDTEARFRGILSDIALWNTTLSDDGWEATGGGRMDDVDETPVAAWRFEEQSGSIAADSEGDNDAKFARTGHGELQEDGLWTPFPGNVSIYLNGRRRPAWFEGTSPLSLAALGTTSAPPGEARLGTNGGDAVLSGALGEVRVWNEARTAQQLAAGRFKRLTGGEANLAANWRLDQVSGDAVDETGNGNDALLPTSVGEKRRPRWSTESPPLGPDPDAVGNALGDESGASVDQSPAVVEYTDALRTETGAVTGTIARAYVRSSKDVLESRPGTPVGTLESKYLGQVQTDPTLVGFIEGPPPLPSENLTRPFYRHPTGGPYLSYLGSSSLDFVEADSKTVALSGQSSEGHSLSASLGGGLAWSIESKAGMGLLNTLWKTEGNVTVSGGAQVETDTTDGRELSTSRGRTRTNHFYNGGDWERGQPLLDDGSSSLDPQQSPRRRFVPGNAGYAVVKSRTADLFGLYLRETGSMVAERIAPSDASEDVNLIYFPMDPTYVKNGTLDGRVGPEPDPDYAESDAERGSYYKPTEAYELEEKVETENEYLRSYYADAFGGSPGRISATSELYGGFSDTERPTVDESGSPYYDWAADRATRSIVDTHVWTTAGGLYTEAQNFSTQREESFGVTTSFDVGASLDMEAKFLFTGGMGPAIQGSATYGWQHSATLTKSTTDDAGFGLDVDADPDGYLSEYEPDDDYWRNGDASSDAVPYTTSSAPGKVDSYRFKSFYLAPEEEHGEAFFDRIVDADWLRNSSSPRASALREARSVSEGEPVWRVLHRTTYVSRVPATPEGLGDEAKSSGVTEPKNQVHNELLLELIESRLPDDVGLPSRRDLTVAVEGVLEEDLRRLLPDWNRRLELAATGTGRSGSQLDEIRTEIRTYLRNLYRARTEKTKRGGEEAQRRD